MRYRRLFVPCSALLAMLGLAASCSIVNVPSDPLPAASGGAAPTTTTSGGSGGNDGGGGTGTGADGGGGGGQGLPNGDPCDSGPQCQSGICADGVCCNDACADEPCHSCAVPPNVGTCLPLPAGEPDGDFCGEALCDGAGHCATGEHLWSFRFGDDLEDQGWSAAIDGQGNIVIAGYFEGSINFGGASLPSNGSDDVFLAKFGPDGTHIWSKSFGGLQSDQAMGVAVDGSGNIVIVGSFRDSIGFGGQLLIGNPNNDDIFVARFLPSGNHVWSNAFGSPTGYDEATSVAIDSSGNAIVTGSFSDAISFGGPQLVATGTNDDAFLVKFMPNGNHVWSSRFGDSDYDQGFRVATDADDSIALAGWYDGGMDLGEGPLPTASNQACFFGKFDPAGNVQFSRGLTAAGGAVCYGMNMDHGGAVLVTGGFGGIIDFGAGPVSSLGQMDAFIAKYAPNGTLEGAYNFGGAGSQAIGVSIAADHAENMVAGVFFEGTLNFGSGPFVSVAGDMALTKFTPGGDLLYARHFETAGTGDELVPFGISVDMDNNSVFTGFFDGTVDFGGGALQAPGTQEDVFLVKFAP